MSEFEYHVATVIQVIIAVPIVIWVVIVAIMLFRK